MKCFVFPCTYFEGDAVCVCVCLEEVEGGDVLPDCLFAMWGGFCTVEAGVAMFGGFSGLCVGF